MKLSPQARGLTLVEMMVTVFLVGIVGLVLYSILYTGTVLGAKNTAMNFSHQQARVAMMDMIQDLHSSVSLPALANASGTPYPSPAPTNSEGIAFQVWSSGPHKIKNDANLGQNQITLNLTTGTGNPTPVAGQHLIVPAYEIEADITAVSGSSSSFTVTLGNIYGPALIPAVTYPVSTLPVAIAGTGSSAGDVICFVTDRCSYTVANSTLAWNWKGNQRTAGTDITNATPFNTPLTPAGALYYRFVAAINLSTSDLAYSNRGYKSANILLNGQVPLKARLTTYQ
jgi:prepilin-type N-terminal cleavage/methylation domain-containing protein